MRPRAQNVPEVVPSDIEDGSRRTVSMTGSGGRPIIQPFQHADPSGKSKGKRDTMDKDGFQKIGMVVGAIWIGGWLLLGMDMLWPLHFVVGTFSSIFGTFSSILSFPPFSWIFGWMYRGAPLVSQTVPAEEMQLSNSQVSQFMDEYVNQYADAALIFASHDGYPQIVKGLLLSSELGYTDLVDARDDSGNTALIYAAAKGFRQVTATLLRNGADPDLANTGGGGRTPLMEAAGQGFRDIVMALRLTPNVTIDMQDDYGNTALHYSAYHGHLAVVLELLKSNPSKDIANIYGHTPGSYAAAQKHSAVVDALNRNGPSRSQRMQQEAEKREEDANKEFQDKLQDTLKKSKEKKDKHVKGSAEDLHKDASDFAPKLEKTSGGASDAERQALENQLEKLRRKHEEVELKTQKRIVELLEKNSNNQRATDQAESENRAAQMNHTELKFKLAELESKHRSSELRAQEEADRAASLHEQHQSAKLEADRHKERAERAERERELHLEASRRHESSLGRVQEEVTQHLSRIDQQNRDITELRSQYDRADGERRRHQDRIDELQRELQRLRGESAAGAAQ